MKHIRAISVPPAPARVNQGLFLSALELLLTTATGIARNKKAGKDMEA